MEPKCELPIKLPDMVMCGDHPSLTKTELNAKEPKDEKDSSTSYSKLAPQSSRTERPPRAEGGERASTLVAARRGEQAALTDTPRPDARRRLDAPGSNALVQAALGSCRWPPCLLAAWLLLLALTHALHCLASVLERALPRLRQLCQYFRCWTEAAWKAENNTARVFPIALGFCTGLLYAFYLAVYMAYSIALWSIEPLSTGSESKHPIQEAMETKVTDYVDEDKSDASLKQ